MLHASLVSLSELHCTEISQFVVTCSVSGTYIIALLSGGITIPYTCLSKKFSFNKTHFSDKLLISLLSHS